ncbi:MAG: hypothetical protein RMK94_07655 [Armatimonadota bacterium]|nr:hypothetical protein [Armatimonadota bacterium]
MSKRWKILGILAFGLISGISWHFSVHWLDLRQREKVAWAFAKAVEKQDFQEATKWIMRTEREKLGVTNQVVTYAFKTLQLPKMKLTGIEVFERRDFRCETGSFWILESKKEPVRVILILQQEGKEWRVNFFFTFRRFCWLKFYLSGMDKIEAYYKAEREAGEILRRLGVKGYVSPFGTVRELGELKGWITPEGWKEKGD